MTIAIGSDHGGYELKLEVIKHLKDRGFEVTDYGCDSTASCDYPIYGKAVAEAIAAGKQDLGILICGTGIGMSMVANKVEGVRAALCSDCFSAQATREHNNANVLCMGGFIIGNEMGREMARAWLEAEHMVGLDPEMAAIVEKEFDELVDFEAEMYGDK